MRGQKNRRYAAFRLAAVGCGYCKWRQIMKNGSLRVLASFFVVLGPASLGFVRAYAQSNSVPKVAAAASTKIPIPDISYSKFMLANGLTVLVHEDHKAPIVAVNTWYHVGSKNEKPGKTGDRKSTRLNSSHRCISYA